MSLANGGPLLAADDPHTFTVHNRNGGSPFLFVGDHAGNAIPRRLGTLGIAASDRQRHIAWDIGTASLGRAMAGLLDAPFIEQTYSRLVIDCNRAPETAGAILPVSDETAIPGNQDLDAIAIRQRIDEIHAPYQAKIAAIIAERCDAARETILVSLHSFTPTLAGVDRPWPIGILHQTGRVDFALDLLAALRASEGDLIGDNEPYRMDETDHTVPRHAWPRGLAYAEIEVRQDQLSTSADIDRMAGILTRALALVADTV